MKKKAVWIVTVPGDSVEVFNDLYTALRFAIGKEGELGERFGNKSKVTFSLENEKTGDINGFWVGESFGDKKYVGQ